MEKPWGEAFSYEEIKYDGILCAAAPPEIPKSLLAFLKVGCCLVLPVGGSKSQKLKIVTKTKKGFDEQECENVSFVPMLGGTSK
jgi:protein-L-isoaspartate(D-aspartate) O-methyltransferase